MTAEPRDGAAFFSEPELAVLLPENGLDEAVERMTTLKRCAIHASEWR